MFHLNINFLESAVVSNLLGFLLRLMLKVMLGVVALVFAASLLAVALLVTVFTLLKALLTGKKPTSAAVFKRFRQYSPQDAWRRTPSTAHSANAVVDVEVREITTGKTTDNSSGLASTANAKNAKNAWDTGVSDDVSDVQPKKSA